MHQIDPGRTKLMALIIIEEKQFDVTGDWGTNVMSHSIFWRTKMSVYSS